MDGKALLDILAALLSRFVVLPARAAEALALWILHTYAFQLRDISTYLGVESPLKRCGKTTLLALLGELAHRPIAAANVSPPAFFRVIEDLAPTLLIDEADTFLPGNDQLKGILNSGYSRKTAYVLRASNPGLPAAALPLPEGEGRVRENGSGTINHQLPNSQPPQVSRFSCWCPKVLARPPRHLPPLHLPLRPRSP